MKRLQNKIKPAKNQNLETVRTNVGSGADNFDENRCNPGSNIVSMLNVLQGSNATTYAEGNGSQLTEILSDPLKALETNERLRNAVAAKGKQMGWNLFPTNNVTSNQIVANNSDSKIPSTDLGEIELNEKIKIHQSADTPDTINILMFGKSGCGQTTLLSYLTENNQLIGTDSMSTQQFSAETFQLPSDSGMTKIRINESPGMCSGFEIEELQQHWNHLISRVNKEGGVSVFLLLIKSNERITSQFIDEIEEFSELYFDEREELWKRTVVVFTSIDELKGCNSLEDRVNKLETQIAKPGMEKVKAVLDQTSTKCIYVSSIDDSDKRRVVKDLNDRFRSIHSGRLRIREPNTQENCESLQGMNTQNDQSSSIVHQPPYHLPDSVNHQTTELTVQYSETENGNRQNSEYLDQISLESSNIKFDVLNDSEETISMESEHENTASNVCEESITQVIKDTNLVDFSAISSNQGGENISYLDNYSKYLNPSGRNHDNDSHSNTNHETNNEYSPHDSISSQPTRASSQRSYLGTTIPFKSQHREHHRDIHLDSSKDPNSKHSGMDRSYSTSSNLSNHSACRPKIPQSLCASNKRRYLHNADEYSEKSVSDKRSMFENKSQSSPLLKREFSKRKQNYDNSLVSSESGNEMKQPRGYGGNQHQEDGQNTKVDITQVVSKELRDKVLEYLENSGTKLLEQLSKEDISKIFSEQSDSKIQEMLENQSRFHEIIEELEHTVAAKMMYNPTRSPHYFTSNKRRRRLLHNADEHSEKSVSDKRSMFENKSQSSPLLKREFSRRKQNYDNSLVSSESGNEMKQPRGYRDNQHQEDGQNTKMDTTQVVSKEICVKVLESLEKNDTKPLEQLSKEELLKILSGVNREEGGKECIIKYVRILSETGQVSEVL